jgi:apolipoprotein N-acyltransferase
MDNLIRLIFVALCTAGLFSIGFSALFELSKVRRGTSMLSPLHFRWRMVSVVLWMFVFGSFAFATLFLWPQNAQDRITGQRFASVIAGAITLMLIALLITVFDVFLTFQERGKHQVEFLRNLEALAHEETKRAQQLKNEKEEAE